MKLKSNRKFKVNKSVMAELLSPVVNELSENLIDDLKKTAPVDDTTKEKAEYIYKSTGKKAWIKDDVESREFWENDNKIRNRKGVVYGSVSNNSPASIALALGFISPLNSKAKAVERRPDGLFSEQSPDGLYINESLERAMKENKLKDIKTEV